MVQERSILGVRPGAGAMTPQGRNWYHLRSPDEPALSPRIGSPEVQISGGRHDEYRDTNGPEGALQIPFESGSLANIMTLPCSRLCDLIIRILSG